eukprot:GHRQ01025901.1.p4 GENE.GHRQ01025901.1~~GHRQ01025901.1.p4  ORF type:complete len:102 (-),score=43.57 GHRQ01025901.1:343-648(-)
MHNKFTAVYRSDGLANQCTSCSASVAAVGWLYTGWPAAELFCCCRVLQVMCDAGEAAAELARCLGPGLVPKEYGGLCSLPYDEYPAQKQLLQYVAKLQQQR